MNQHGMIGECTECDGQMIEPEADKPTPNSWWLCLDCDLSTMPGISAARHLDSLDHTVVRLR